MILEDTEKKGRAVKHWKNFETQRCMIVEELRDARLYDIRRIKLEELRDTGLYDIGRIKRHRAV